MLKPLTSKNKFIQKFLNVKYKMFDIINVIAVCSFIIYFFNSFILNTICFIGLLIHLFILRTILKYYGMEDK